MRVSEIQNFVTLFYYIFWKPFQYIQLTKAKVKIGDPIIYYKNVLFPHKYPTTYAGTFLNAHFIVETVYLTLRTQMNSLVQFEILIFRELH